MTGKIKKSLLVASILTGCFFAYHKLSQPLISVVMPVYNRADLLPRAIDSILAQTYKDFEFIIVDDGSTDNSVQIIEQYMEKDKRIKLVKNVKNRGIAYSRTRGNAEARGKYIAVMDSDDQALPHRLETSLKVFKEHPEIDALSAGLWDIEKPIPAAEILRWKDYEIVHNHHSLSMMFSNTFSNVASMFKRDFIEKYNIKYNEKYVSAEDYDFWKQFIINGGNLISVTTPVTFVRRHRTNDEPYYEKMVENSTIIQNELLHRFFDEIPDIQKTDIDLLDKCKMLDEVEKANKSKKVIPDELIADYKDSLCPPRIKDAYFLVHPAWSYFITTNGDQCKVWKGDLRGTYEKKDDLLIIDWLQYPAETFKKHPEKDAYYYLPDNHFKVEHKAWTDLFIVKEDNESRFCRFSRGDCGTILSKTDKELKVKWDNTNYPIETFVYDKQKQTYVQK